MYNFVTYRVSVCVCMYVVVCFVRIVFLKGKRQHMVLHGPKHQTEPQWVRKHEEREETCEDSQRMSCL